MFGAGNFTAAERLAREALAAEPNISAGHTLLSRALSAQGRAKPSLAAAEAALALFPSAHAFHAQALALRAIRRRRDAVAAAREAVRLAPSRPEHPNLLGILLEESGQQTEARATLRHAMSLAPGNDSFRASYGLFLLRHRGLAEAEQVAAELAPGADGREALLLRGKLALLRHRPAEARDFALWILSRAATDQAALRLLVEARAGASGALRLWWRYRMFLATGPRWALVLVVAGLVVALFLPGLHLVAVCLVLYMASARRTFQTWLRREMQALQGVRLNKKF